MYITIMGYIARPMGMLLNLLYGFIQNYGITLIVFTIIIKLLLYPLYAHQIKSTARMGDLQPKIKAIQNKFSHDKALLNEKLSQLYKDEKYNPMSGCLPMLIQMPIIFGLFVLLRNPMQFIDNADMMLAVHESFFWIMDLSQPDSWILPLGAGITTYISFSQTQSQTTIDPNNPMSSMTSIMKYFFPVMIVWMGRSFPAGLALYWFIGTLMQILFNLRLNQLRRKLKEKQ